MMAGAGAGGCPGTKPGANIIANTADLTKLFKKKDDKLTVICRPIPKTKKAIGNHNK